MHDKHGIKTEGFPLSSVANTSKTMSPAEFEALGAHTVAFTRTMNGTELQKFIPEVENAPQDATFEMIVSADGKPILVADEKAAIAEWLDDKEITLVRRH